MRTIHLIHGFNESHDNQQPAIAVLRPLLEDRGYNVMVHDYGELHLFETTANDNLARLIRPSIRSGDTLVGFSNGAAIISHLQDMGVFTPRIVLIQPALRNDWIPNIKTQVVSVFWNPGDKATIAGKWWRRFTSLFPWQWGNTHRWGEMGHTGYVGNDPRFVQYRTDQSSMLPNVLGHGQWANPKNNLWHRFMVDRM